MILQKPKDAETYSPVDGFRFYFSYAVSMFQGPTSAIYPFVIACKSRSPEHSRARTDDAPGTSRIAHCEERSADICPLKYARAECHMTWCASHYVRRAGGELCSTRMNTSRARIAPSSTMGACMIAGIRLAREKHVNVRVIPTSHAIDESVDLAHEIFTSVFRKVPRWMAERRL
jgi:hypothetical protein